MDGQEGSLIQLLCILVRAGALYSYILKVRIMFGVQISCASVKLVELQWVKIQIKEITTPIFLFTYLFFAKFS